MDEGSKTRYRTMKNRTVAMMICKRRKGLGPETGGNKKVLMMLMFGVYVPR